MYIILCGMMGSGKTQVGLCLARMLNLTFMDLDALIEQELGMTVSQAFAELGEAGFRKQEEEMMQRLALSRRRGVLALGGGSVLSQSGMTALKQCGKVVYLRAKPSTLAQRLSKSKLKRPLIATAIDVEETLSQILAKRESIYIQYADYIVDTEGKSTQDIATALALWWKEGKNEL